MESCSARYCLNTISSPAGVITPFWLSGSLYRALDRPRSTISNITVIPEHVHFLGQPICSAFGWPGVSTLRCSTCCEHR